MFWLAKNLSLTIPSSENMSFDVRNQPFSLSSDLRGEYETDEIVKFCILYYVQEMMFWVSLVQLLHITPMFLP